MEDFPAQFSAPSIEPGPADPSGPTEPAPTPIEPITPSAPQPSPEPPGGPTPGEPAPPLPDPSGEQGPSAT